MDLPLDLGLIKKYGDCQLENASRAAISSPYPSYMDKDQQ